MKNTDLKQTYNKMHKTGKKAWFDDGDEERQAIIDMGGPWQGKRVLEIGCGEGDLLDMLNEKHAITTGIDYSLEAITTAKLQYPYLDVLCCEYDKLPKSHWSKFDVVVMQGVLEHMDDWSRAVDEIILRYKPDTVITSMPAFLNIRGIIWHTLDMLGAVMSKTDLHYIDIWEVEAFCVQRGYIIEKHTIDHNWGNGKKMIEDLSTRIRLALVDGKIQFSPVRLAQYLKWLEMASEYFDHDEGAVNIYRIDL